MKDILSSSEKKASSDDAGIYRYLNKLSLKFHDANLQNEWVIKEIDTKRVYAALSFLQLLAGVISNTVQFNEL